MAKILHLIIRSDDSLAPAIAKIQEKDPANEVEVIDLSADEPDYGSLVMKIFAADSIATW